MKKIVCVLRNAQKGRNSKNSFKNSYIFLFLSSKVSLDVPLYAVGRLSAILHLF